MTEMSQPIRLLILLLILSVIKSIDVQAEGNRDKRSYGGITGCPFHPCPENAQCVSGTCVCKPGCHLVGTQCLRGPVVPPKGLVIQPLFPCPDHMVYTKHGICECEHGYTLSGSICVPVPTVVHGGSTTIIKTTHFVRRRRRRRRRRGIRFRIRFRRRRRRRRRRYY